MTFIKTIIDEMISGNFSFAILIVGILQLIVMIVSLIKKGKSNGKNH